MKPYGLIKKKWGLFDDFVRKSKETFANPKLRNARKRLKRALKRHERRNNKCCYD